ncbi:MAG: hypothetical protein V3T24_09670 [Longimicrobiales bacterium]
MPDPTRPRYWDWLGRALPRSLRELMYQPLCDDLWRAHVTAAVRRGRLVLWFRFAGCFAASVGYSMPRYFVERDRMTLLGRSLFVLAAAALVLAIVTLTPWIITLTTGR